MISGVSSSSGCTSQPAQKQDEAASDARSDSQASGDSVKLSETAKAANDQKLTPEELDLIRRLQVSDREVRAHEQAHQAAGAGLTGSMNLTYQIGPDGKQYAIGGEVSIDTGPAKTPSATITKMQRVIAAALAPGNPSGQDRAVAAQAQSRMAEARVELAKEQAQQSDAPTTENEKQPDRTQRAYGAEKESSNKSGDLLNLVA